MSGRRLASRNNFPTQVRGRLGPTISSFTSSLFTCTSFLVSGSTDGFAASRPNSFKMSSIKLVLPLNA
eukprot:4416589-Pyramimonas_sp.AAC.2